MMLEQEILKQEVTDEEAIVAVTPAEQPAEQPKEQIEIPEKFRDPETGEVRLEALLESYKELEHKMSAPKENMRADLQTEEGRRAVQKELGCPECASEYNVDVTHGLFDADDEVNVRLHEKGFTVDQVQEVYDLAAEKLVPAILEMVQEFEADREVERLIAAFGGEEKWREISRQLFAYGQKSLPTEVLDNLSGSFEGVMALHRMMKSDEPGISMREQSSAGQGNNELDLRAMMRDPRYWKQKDPAFVAKVTQGFERIYEEK